MIHSHELVRITRIRRKAFTILLVVVLLGAIIVSAKKIYFAKSALPGFQSYQDVLKTYQKTAIHTTSGDAELLLEIADTPRKHQDGLMFRRNLAKNSGMLFVFGADATNPFWMKNTLLPLDILFISENKTIVDFATMEPCIKDPCPLYASRTPYRYAIEVSKEFIRDNKIRIGDSVSFL